MAQSRGENEGEGDNQNLDASTGHVVAVNNSEVTPIVTLAQFVLDEQKRTEKLLPIEEHWRDRYELLLDHGYQLRSRLRPGWVPSWRDTQLHPGLFEDGYKHWIRQVIDATRIKDGATVIIKEVQKLSRSEELEVMQDLTPDLTNVDPTNHCAPALDHFSDERDVTHDFIVMPLYRSFDDPDFYAVGEAIEFVKQTLEGVQYMHDRNVAHRDLASPNIMMDGRSLYPKGFHPSAQYMSPSCKTRAAHLRRIHAPPVKYVFVDFGISIKFSESQERLTFDTLGREDAPELEDAETSHDPFALDIYVLGKVYQRKFLEKFTNLAFLLPLVDSMTQKDPKKRPTIQEAIEHFNKTRESLGLLVPRKPLHAVDDTQHRRWANDILAILLDAKFFAARAVSRVNPLRMFAKKPRSS